MKNTAILAILLVLALAPAARAADEESFVAREAAAKEYLVVMPISKIVDQVLEAVYKNPNNHISASGLDEIRAGMDMNALNKAAVDGLVKTFTVEELKAMTQFYGSSTGQSVIKKMPLYVLEVAPVIQQQALKIIVAHAQKQKQNGVVSSRPNAELNP